MRTKTDSIPLRYLALASVAALVAAAVVPSRSTSAEDGDGWTLPGAVVIRRENDEGEPSESINGDGANHHQSVLEPDHLIGDRWGAPPVHAPRGMNAHLAYTGESFRNTRGGLNSDEAREYRMDVSLTVEVRCPVHHQSRWFVER